MFVMTCDAQLQPSGSGERNYEGLIDVLRELSQVPDAIGQTILNEEEAAQISVLGFPAAPGQWFVPLLPHDLVRGDGLLECLSDAWAEDVDARRLLSAQVEKTDGEIDEEDSAEPGDRIWSEDEVRVLEALQRDGRWAKKRKLQKRLWRMGARRFNEALASLQARGALELNASVVRLTMTELGRNPSANLQMPENAALFQPVDRVSVHRKDRRSERPTG